MNVQRFFLLAMLGGTVFARAELAPPSGARRETPAGTEVSWPYGSVRIDKKKPSKNDVLATTLGDFRVRYRLVKRKGWTEAERVDITVQQHVCYLAGKTDRLEEHEAGHVAINRGHAQKIEKQLSGFRFPSEEPDLSDAEEAFRTAFRAQVAAVDERHAAWDRDHPVD